MNRVPTRKTHCYKPILKSTGQAKFHTNPPKPLNQIWILFKTGSRCAKFALNQFRRYGAAYGRKNSFPSLPIKPISHHRLFCRVGLVSVV